MGDRLLAGIPPWYIAKPTRSTRPSIPPGSLNRVPALIGWGKGRNVTSAGWQVTLCEPPIWHVSSRSGDREACCEMRYTFTLLTYLLTFWTECDVAATANWVVRCETEPSAVSSDEMRSYSWDEVRRRGMRWLMSYEHSSIPWLWWTGKPRLGPWN